MLEQHFNLECHVCMKLLLLTNIRYKFMRWYDITDFKTFYKLQSSKRTL